MSPLQGVRAIAFTPTQKAAFGLLFAVLLSLIAGCERRPEPLSLSGFTMGTAYHITVADPGDADAAAMQGELDQLLAMFNQIASTYIEDSELNRLNHAATGQWLAVSETLSDMLMLAMELSWLTGGSFDITVAPLVDLWGFGPQQRTEQLPAAAAIAAARQNVGYQHLEIDFADARVRKQRDIHLDLSALAKGYGVDLVALWLERQGFAHYLVEIGGEIRSRGHSPRGDDWRVAIEQPADGERAVHRAIRVSGVAVATSGDYRNYFERDGQRYSHTIDPATGSPVHHGLASVTVISDTAAYADALATAFTVMGPEKTRRFAEQQGIAVYLIEKTATGFSASHSSHFAKYLD